jgi:4,5-DOPA dioxygenase extradiol
MLPALFLDQDAAAPPPGAAPAHATLQEIAGLLGQPRAIVAASARWETEIPALDAAAAPDFAERASDLLCAAGLRSRLDRAGRRSDAYDRAPLRVLYTENAGMDVPFVPLSVQPHLGPAHHVQLGRALAPLRAEGVLVLGLGCVAACAEGPGADAALLNWLDRALAEGRTCDLVTYRARAPGAARQRSAERYLLPLFVAMGASNGDATRPLCARRLDTETPGARPTTVWAFG